MNLAEYKYAETYIHLRRAEVKRLKKLDDKAQHYFDVSTHITPSYGSEFVENSFKESKVANAIGNMIDAQMLKTEVAEHFLEQCHVLDEVDDSAGAMIIYYFCIMQNQMPDVARMMDMSLRTCWRHLNIAVSELDEILQAKEN